MRRHIQMAHHILPFKFHIHGPHVEVNLTLGLAGDHALLGRCAGFVAGAGFEVGLVFEHDLLAGDFYFFASLGRVAGHGRVGIGDGHTGRCGRGLGRREGHVGEGCDGFAVCGFAGDFTAVGENVISHDCVPIFPLPH